MNVGELRKAIEHMDDSTVLYAANNLRSLCEGVDAVRLIAARDDRTPILLLETGQRLARRLELEPL